VATDLGDATVDPALIPTGTFTWNIVQEIADATQSSAGISSADRIIQISSDGVIRAGKKYGTTIFGVFSGDGGTVLRATASVTVGP
jgi:hypothetical protein